MPYGRHKRERRTVGMATYMDFAAPKTFVARKRTLCVQNILAYESKSLRNLERTSRRIFHTQGTVYGICHIRFGHKAFNLAC